MSCWRTTRNTDLNKAVAVCQAYTQPSIVSQPINGLKLAEHLLLLSMQYLGVLLFSSRTSGGHIIVIITDKQATNLQYDRHVVSTETERGDA
jgi:hypothetical protein